MKRTSLTRKTPLKAKSALKRVTQLRPRSEKRIKLYKEERIPLVIELLEANPWCQLGPLFRAVDPTYSLCTHQATCVDELKKRSAGGDITDRENCRTSCWNCNQHKENEPLLADRAGLTVHAWEQP